jgi:colanic acid biosynthesis glycosyl transferase WcaI
VLAAADRLRACPRLLFVLVGEGARKAWLMNQAAARGLPNLRFFPYQPRERLAESLGAADVHLIPLKAGAAGCLVPSKVYGIMAAARPFVAMMEPGAEVARLAARHDLGPVIPPGDEATLAAALLELMEKPERIAAMGLNGRHVALRYFERKIITRKFGEVLAGIASDDKQLSSKRRAEFIKIPETA